MSQHIPCKASDRSGIACPESETHICADIHAVKKPIKLTRTNMEKLGAKIKKYGVNDPLMALVLVLIPQPGHSVVKKATRATSASQKV